MNNGEQQQSVWQQHGQSILSTLVLLAILAVGQTVIGTNSDVRVLSAKFEGLTKIVEAGTQDRYTGSDADKDLNHVYERLLQMQLQFEKDSNLMWKRIEELHTDMKQYKHEHGIKNGLGG